MDTALYAPEGHAVHTSEVAAFVTVPYLPAAHPVHTVDVPAAATSPKAPAAHAVQADVPVVSPLYAPVVHETHVAPAV